MMGDPGLPDRDIEMDERDIHKLTYATPQSFDPIRRINAWWIDECLGFLFLFILIFLPVCIVLFSLRRF